MLTETSESGARAVTSTLQGQPKPLNQAAVSAAASGAKRSRLAKVLRIEWIGQTVASLCWIASVFVYGISSAGDWLQLGAASAWFVANLAAAVASEAD